MTKNERAIIVDDHALVRAGLRGMLERFATIRVVGEAGDATEALALASRAKPDLALVDICLPGTNGIELTRKLRRQHPEMHILIVSMHCEAECVARAIRAGANGFIAKQSSPETLLRGIEALREGKIFLDGAASPEVLRLIQKDEKEKRPKAEDADLHAEEIGADLTPREMEILAQIAEGLSAKQIGVRLHISPRTVENHRANIMRKLNLHSGVELTRYALRIGLIDPEAWSQR